MCRNKSCLSKRNRCGDCNEDFGEEKRGINDFVDIYGGNGMWSGPRDQKLNVVIQIIKNYVWRDENSTNRLLRDHWASINHVNLTKRMLSLQWYVSLNADLNQTIIKMSCLDHDIPVSCFYILYLWGLC